MAMRWRYSGVGLSSLLLLWSSLFLCQCVPTATARRVHHHDSTDHSDQEVDLRDVISVRISHDGLRELRVSFHGVLLLETSRVSQQGDRDSSGEHVPVRLLQVTDGRQVVQHVQQGEVTRDCSVSRDWVDVLDFVEHYLHGVPRHAPHGDVMAVYRNATRARQSLPRSWRRTSTSSSVKSPRRDRRTKLGRRGVSMHVRGPGSLGRFARYLHVRQQARQCRKFLSLARHRAQASEDSGVPPPSVSQSARDSADGTEPTPVSLSQSSDSSGSVDSTSGQRFSSHSRQHSGSERSRETQSADSVTEAGPREEQGSLVHSRQKRDLLSGWFIFPGTKWCGDGDIAEHGDDLGYDEELDSCCREHDRCKHVIPRVSWRYSLFNYRLHTMSHCRCDRMSKKTECPAFIFVSADRKKGLLWIKNMMNSHNHESSNNNDAEVQLKISGVLTEIQLSCYNVHDEELERRHSALAKLLEGWQNTTSLGMNHAGPVSLSPKNIADTDEPDLGLTLPDEKLAARVKQLKSELFAIFDGTKESDRHKLYCRGGVSRRSLDGYGGLGYLQEGQEDLVMDILLSLFSKHGTLSLNMADYLMRVLLPEVVDKIFVSQS